MGWKGTVPSQPVTDMPSHPSFLGPAPGMQMMRLNATEEQLQELSSEMSTAFCSLAEVYLTDLWWVVLDTCPPSQAVRALCCISPAASTSTLRVPALSPPPRPHHLLPLPLSTARPSARPQTRALLV